MVVEGTWLGRGFLMIVFCGGEEREEWCWGGGGGGEEGAGRGGVGRW